MASPKVFHHIALTGPAGVGKTTLVKNLIQQLNQQGVSCYGFLTEEVREQGKRIGFDVISLDGRKSILSRTNSQSSGQDGGTKNQNQHTVGQYVVDIASFESLVLPLLSHDMPENSVLVIDEIGKMEMFSSQFVSKIKSLINSSKNPMLVTVPVPKGRPISLIQEIRNHKDVTTIAISFSNRDDANLHKDIIRSLTKDILPAT